MQNEDSAFLGENETRQRLKRVIKTPLLRIWRCRLLPESVKDLALYLINTKYIVGALAVVSNTSGCVLLFNHTYFAEEPWGLPGGAAKHEDIEEALRREIWEESRYSIRIDHNIGVAQWGRRRIDFLFACSISGGQFAPSEEVKNYGYFYLDGLPEVRRHHRTMLTEIARMTGNSSRLDTSISGLFLSLSAMNSPKHIGGA